MSMRQRLQRFVGFEPMMHRPPLRRRFWIYAAAAYLIPVVVQVAFPDDPGLTDELVWLVTLVPAFLLALHYGLKGAFAALVMGTGLFIVVQLVVAINFTPDDWRITVPTYIAYGTLALSVGWLSEELHNHYQTALTHERLAAIGELAVTINHEINNALTAIVTESQYLTGETDNLRADQQASIQSIHEAAMRIAGDVEKITRLEAAPATTYLGVTRMVDLRSATTRPA